MPSAGGYQVASWRAILSLRPVWSMACASVNRRSKSPVGCAIWATDKSAMRRSTAICAMTKVNGRNVAGSCYGLGDDTDRVAVANCVARKSPIPTASVNVLPLPTPYLMSDCLPATCTPKTAVFPINMLMPAGARGCLAAFPSALPPCAKSWRTFPRTLARSRRLDRQSSPPARHGSRQRSSFRSRDGRRMPRCCPNTLPKSWQRRVHNVIVIRIRCESLLDGMLLVGQLG